MKLTSYPQNYSSVFADNILRFEEVTPNEPFEVSFQDDVVGLLGTKRFVGAAEVECSLHNYLHRRLNPQPIILDRCAFNEAAGRNVRLTALWGDNQKSHKMTFTLSHTNLTAPAIVGDTNQSRRISAGEVDEIAFVVGRERNICAKVVLSTGEKYNIYTKTLSNDGLWVWVVCADEIISRSVRPEELESFSIEIVVGEESLGTVTYTLAPVQPEAVRLAWLDADGRICYHTFPLAMRKEVEADSSVAELTDGTTILYKSGWKVWRLDSGVVSREVVAHLEGIATSPRVWVVEGGVATPMVLLSSQTRLSGVGRGVSLVLRPAKKTTYW
ncbi:MAG: hypothetical protein J6K78_05505 [Tidjanibacter sp.]|nr:hypothetical protein [Tidjanibacter sp.]